MGIPTIEGNLADFHIGDVLQFLALSKRTGRLDLTHRERRAVIVLRDGRLLYAATGSAKETLGHLLTSRGLVEPAELQRALEVHRADPERHLGTVLVEMGLIGDDLLRRLVTEQLDEVITELLHWPGGHFAFTPLRLDDRGEVEVEARNLHLEIGVSADELLLRASSRADLAGRDAAAGGAPVPSPPPRERVVHELATLRSIVQEIRSPVFTGELTLEIMDYARQHLERGVLFAVRLGGFGGIGQYGLELPGGADPNEAVRDLRIPLDQPSLISEAAERRRPCRARIPRTPWDELLVEQLGGGGPREAVALPLIVDDRVLLVLYGDDGPGRVALPSLEGLELLLLEVGGAMESDLLRKRLDHYERLRSARSAGRAEGRPTAVAS